MIIGQGANAHLNKEIKEVLTIPLTGFLNFIYILLYIDV